MLLGIVTGAFTEILLKHLQRIDLDVDELANAVTKEMVDKYGMKQMPVSVHCFHKLISTTHLCVVHV